MKHIKPVVFCCVVTLLGLVMVGCGGQREDLAPVEGTVTLDDRPLVGAIVEFQPVVAFGGSASPSLAETDENGHYELEFAPDTKGAMIGDHTVRITKEVTTEKDGKVVVTQVVPEKYNRKTTLKKTVNPEENVIDFPLSSD